MDDLDLSVFFHTKIQANDFLVRMSNFSEEIYKTEFSLEKSLINNFGVEKKDRLLIFFRDNKINVQSIADLKKFIDKLQEKISNLPTLSLTLAFEPNIETLNLLNEWFLINLKRQFIFDINVNPDLIAGIAINFNGRYLDYSVKQKFDKILQNALNNTTPDTPKQKDKLRAEN